MLRKEEREEKGEKKKKKKTESGPPNAAYAIQAPLACGPMLPPGS